ncbi:MAG: NADH-quinone oxidoreductase subunit NuoK [Verrucomicrobiia bacterium]|nr:NADH-quinone oxidoreductase subunit NuoK [Verrucomicrobiae bacterium]
MITLSHYLWVSGLLFLIGLGGVILRRNIIVIYMGLELMLTAGNLAMVAFSQFRGGIEGQLLVFFVITVAAAEVAVGLAIIVAMFRLKQTARVEDLRELKF